MWAGWVHHSWRFGHAEALREVGPEMPERWSKTSTVPVVWATFGIFSTRFKWFPVGRDWWPWTKPGYVTMTRRQSNNQWSGGIAADPAPRNSECKNPLEKFSPRFFGIKTASSSLIIFQRAKLSTRSIINLCWCNWRTFGRENAAEVHQGVFVLARQCPGSRALATQKKLAYLGFQCLDHPLYSPDLAPSDYRLFPGLKKQLNVRHFSSATEVIVAAETWLDGQLSEFFFFKWLA